MTRLVMESSSLTPEYEPPQNPDMFPLNTCRLGMGTDNGIAESTCNTSGAPNTVRQRARRTHSDSHELPVQCEDAESGTKSQLEHCLVSAASERLPVGSKRIHENSGPRMIQVSCAGWQCFRTVVPQHEDEDGYSETEYLDDELPATPTSTLKHFSVPNTLVLHGGKRRRISSDSDSPISKKPRLVHFPLPVSPKVATGYQHGSDDHEEDFDGKGTVDKSEKSSFKFEKWDGPRSYPLKDATFRHFEKARYYSSYTISHGKSPQETITPYTQEENEHLVELIRQNLKHKDLCDQFNQRFASKLVQGSKRPERSAGAISKNIERRGLRTQAALPVQSTNFPPGYQKTGSPQ